MFSIILSLVIAAGLISGFVLFRRNTIPAPSAPVHRTGPPKETISIIIPARNEEHNLPLLLKSLQQQTRKPDEIIVVDDHSVDRTRQIAESYGVRVITSPELPKGWTGKNWALWNGYQQSTGDLLIFLDADVRLAETAIESLAAERGKQGGVISAFPYHMTEKFYERFAMILNMLGVFVFTSPFERKNREKGLFGACIVTTREDYEKIGGHKSIHAEMLEDLNLGASFQRAGIKVTNYIGFGLVSFRMYPDGIRSVLQGFGKAAILSIAKFQPLTLFFVILWLIGLIISQCWIFTIGYGPWLPLLIGYILYAIEIYIINHSIGRFGWIHPALHVLSTIFFLIVLVYSLYHSLVRKQVIWKGRYIDVGGKAS